MSADFNPTPPLRALAWNGHTLRATVEGDLELELWLDGARFVTWPAGQGGERAQAFRWVPGGGTTMALEVRHHGLPLHAPVWAEWGRAGLHAGALETTALLPIDAAAEERLDLGPAGRGAMMQPVTIIVPVYNAVGAVTRCLAALREHTLRGARLLLIDDASSEPGIAPLLAVAATWPNVRVLRNRRNRGFTTTVNRGLDEVGPGDVVLLNADTEVGPGWLGALRRAAWASADTASATAVSDNAGAFSVPELEHANPLPAAWSHVDAARALLHDAGLAFPRLPTGNGFCMLLRGDARQRVGKLDDKAFPRGYGEENDWSQRAERAGFRHVIAGNVFVAHARSQSFGAAERQELGQRGMAVLRRRYPNYEAAIGAQLWSWSRLVLDWRVRRLWATAGAAPRPRVLVDDERTATAWRGWEAWRLLRQGVRVRLLDAGATERGEAIGSAESAALVAWLQRYGFEAAALRDASASLVTTLGIPCAPTPERMQWAFRA